MIRSLFFFFLLVLLIASPVGAQKAIVVGGSGSDLETFRMLSKAFKQHHPESQFEILPSIGSGGALRGVFTDRVDIGLMTRPLKKKEQAYGLSPIAYADTGVVYIVSKGHPVKNVTTDELKAIYSGVNAKNGLTPILRPKLDSDTFLFKEKFPEIMPALNSAYERKGVPIAMSDQLTIEMLMSTNNAIATSTLSQLISEQRPVQVLNLNGVKPDYNNFSNGTYPLTKRYFIVHNGQLSGYKGQFIEFIFSMEGKEILRQTGHVPLDRKK